MAVVDFSMQNKIAIVTGGSKGIGRAIALAFAEHGADMVIAARGAAALESTKKEIEATGRRCIAINADMANEADWERLVVKTVAVFGAVDVLVNNAATADKLGPVHETSGEAWDHDNAGQSEGAVLFVEALSATYDQAWRGFYNTHYLG